MRRRLSLSIASALLFAGSPVWGQAVYTASRRFDLQAGGGVVLARSDYDPKLWRGYGLYTTLDFSRHLGAEFDLHKASARSGANFYERTYEFGARYRRTYNRFTPYVRGAYGRGVFNFATSNANLAYNLFSFGAGVDFAATQHINLRADYDYQHWLSFPPSGLAPQVVTFGAAYHIPGTLRRSRHW